MTPYTQKDIFSVPILLTAVPYEITNTEIDFIYNSAYNVNYLSDNLTSADRSILENDALAGMKTYIDAALKTYAHELLRWVPQNELFVTQSWINRNAMHTRHGHHIHPNSFVSGIMYLTDDPMPTVFTQSTNNMFPLDMPCLEENPYNQKFRAHEVSPDCKGQLLIFPSTTEHFVPPNQNNEERMTLSFNTWASGSAGDEKNLTYLDLPLERKEHDSV